jgi:hypothetical protein
MIEKYSLGEIVVNGVSYIHDIKMIQGEVIPNWWRKTGHRVGLEDIRDIIEAEPDILVIGQGKPGYMKSTRSLQEFLARNGIDLIEETTSEAVRTTNKLLGKGQNFAAGFHLTC